MTGSGALAYVDDAPVPCALTKDQVTLLFPRGVIGLRAVPANQKRLSGSDGDSSHSTEESYVFPAPDGMLRLLPGRRYTLAPMRCESRPSSGAHAESFVTSPDANVGEGRGTVQSTSSRSTAGWVPTHNDAADRSVPLASWRREAPAFTPPVPEEAMYGRLQRGTARLPSQDLSQVTRTPALLYQAEAPHTTSTPNEVHEVHGSARVPAFDTSVASSVSEIMEDGPSVGHLLNDLCIDPDVDAATASAPGRASEDDPQDHRGHTYNEESLGERYACETDVNDGHAPHRRSDAYENDGDMLRDPPSCASEDSHTPTSPRAREQAWDEREGTPQNPGSQRRRPGKLVQDRVHEHVLLPMLAIDIVDTPEFQRLRGLKQLGTTVYLYPGATHTRFEHCIGVAHLASQMVRSIASRQPELRITEADVLCVTVAGLCHDIGHGPFSHLFEQVINRMRLERVVNAGGAAGEGLRSEDGNLQTPRRRGRGNDSMPRNDRTLRRDDPRHAQRGASLCGNTPLPKADANKRWHHEHMSIALLRTILSRMDLAAYGLNDADARFIELCILGLPPSKSWPDDVGRPPHKRFLVDIVSNKRHGIDVDKLDYFLRDSLGVYGKAAADVHFPRILSACRVLPFEGQFQICYEEKLALNLGDIFAVRAKLHKYAYQHRIVKVTDYMVSDALAAADPYFFITGSHGQRLRISESVDDHTAFCQLGDWILNAIAASGEAALAPARHIITRLTNRDLYPIVGQATFGASRLSMKENTILEELVDLTLAELSASDKYDEMNEEAWVERLRDVIIVSFTSITYGSSDSSGVADDPISNVTFYNPKHETKQAFKLPTNRLSPLFSPIAYQEHSMMVLVRDSDLAAEVAEACNRWKERRQHLLSVAVPNSNARGSPVKRPREVRSSQPNDTPFKPRRLEGVPTTATQTSGARSRDREYGADSTRAATAAPQRQLYNASTDGIHRRACHTDPPAATDAYREGAMPRRRSDNEAGDARPILSPSSFGRPAPQAGSRTTSDLIPNPHLYASRAQPADARSAGGAGPRNVPPPPMSSTASIRLSAGGLHSSQGVLSNTESSSSGVVVTPQQYARGVPPMLHGNRTAPETKTGRQR